MQSIFNAIKAFFDFVASIPQFLLDTVIKAINSVFTMLKDVFMWILEQMLNLVTSILSGFDLSAINNALGSYSLPPEIVNMLGLIGIGEALGIIVSALVIRFLLQLIPFVRLGS